MHIQLYKNPDIPHYRWRVHDLGSDDLGSWFGCEGGTTWTRGDATGEFENDALFLVPRGDWWLAELTRQEAGITCYTHVCTTPQISDDQIVAIDLDLDVQRLPGSAPTLLDEDEFRQNTTLLSYPVEWVPMIERVAHDLMRGDEQALEWIAASTKVWFPRLQNVLEASALEIAGD